MPALEPTSISRIAALSLFACLSMTASSSALAAPADAAESPGAADAESIFRRGQAKYETADYNGAIELWTEAYGLIDSTPENASIKALIIYNLAQAHTKAFELDDQVIHLKQAQRLLQSFRDNLELLYEDPEALAAESARVEENLAQIDAQLAAVEAEAEPEPQPEPPPPTVEPETEPEEEGPPPKPLKPGKPLIFAGAGVLAVGVGGLATAIAGVVIGTQANDVSEVMEDPEARAEQFARGRTANLMLLIGGITAGALMPTGDALIGVGIAREKRKQKAQQTAASLRVGPNFGGSWGQGGGLSLSGRF